MFFTGRLCEWPFFAIFVLNFRIMILLRYFSSLFLLAFAVVASAADAVDSEGYPVMYVRGATTDNWSAKPEYRMSRSGDMYSIHLPQLDGEFKISGSEWRYNFGADGAKLDVKGTMEVAGVQDGANFVAANLVDVTISFSHGKDDFAAYAPAVISIVAKSVGSEPSGTLPVLYINVYDASGGYDNEIIDRNLAHKNYFAGEYWLEANGCEGVSAVGSPESPMPLQIKARGNYTRTGFAKKPFKIKLDKKQSLAGLSKSKHFALLAHADDNYGYLRNFCGFNLGRRIGLPWTPRQQPVELVVNGDYRGLYFLTESIRVEEGRIEIAALADSETDTAQASGGYLVELDNYDEDNQIRMPEKSCVSGHLLDALRITWDTPEEYSELQKRFVTDQFTAMNDYVGANDDALWSYLDLDDAARYYIVEEIISHTEAFHGSTYLFRDRGEGQKWHFSPLWDCGNAFNGPVDDYFYNHDAFGNTWIPSIATNNTFKAKVRATWLWFMSACFEGFRHDIEAFVSQISIAAVCDRARWKNAPRPDGGVTADVADNSDMDGRCKAVVNHIESKLQWLSGKWGLYGDVVAEPPRDDTPAAPLPEYLASGISSPEVGGDATAEFYNLQGIRVTNPQHGCMYVVRRGGMARKVLY